MRTCKMIDFAVPRDSGIEKEKEKIEKYQDLSRGITEDLECESEDYTIRSLGAIPQHFGNILELVSRQKYCKLTRQFY